MWYRHKGGYPWEVKKTCSYRLGKQWGPDVDIDDFPDHKEPDKLLLHSENMYIDNKNVGKSMRYWHDETICQDGTFDEKGRQTKTKWNFWLKGTVA